MVTEDLLTVGTLDLLGGCAPAVFAQTQDGVVILALSGSVCRIVAVVAGMHTFQSLASRVSMTGSSGSEISPSSSSSVFLTECWAWILSSSEKVRW